MKLNLRVKLIGSFGIVLLLMVVVGLVGIYTSKTIQDRMDNIIEKDIKPANIMGDVGRRVGLVRANSLLHLVTHSIDDMNRYESEMADWIDKVNIDLNTLENIFEDQATLDKLADFRTAWETYLRTWREQVVPLSLANRDEEAFSLARKTGAGGMAAREAMHKLDELHDANVAAANHRLKLANQDSMKSLYILSAVILLAIIFVLAFGVRQGSRIAGSVNTVSKAAQLVAAGDLDQRAMVRTGDEIESMANSFNAMTVKLKTMVEKLQSENTVRKRTEEELAKHSDHLEELVQDRTEALQKSKEHYRLLAENVTDVIWTLDMNLWPIYMSPSVTRMRGYSVEEAMAQPLEKILTPASFETAMKAFAEEMAAEEIGQKDLSRSRTLELENYCKDSSTVWTEIKVTGLRDPEGRLVGLLGVSREITERRRAEDILRQSEEKYRTMIELSNDMIWTLDKAGNFTFFNDQAEKVSGEKLNDWIGKSFASLIVEEDLPMVERVFQKSLKGESLQYEARIKKQTKDILTISVNTAPILKNGIVHGTISFGRDITEQRKLETQLQQSQKMEAIGTLAGGIAHDFNNILFPILGHTELLLMDTPDDSPSIGNLKAINTAALRAKSLVKQILAFSRQDSGELMLMKMQPIVKEALKLIRSTIPTTIEIIQDINPGCGIIKADPTQIHQ
ncbi:MAG: PAS domain S-box protein, partial [Proteobacteria bacterium]|nr:PAS domain S-box protein [Pseudomonadota bacterium]